MRVPIIIALLLVSAGISGAAQSTANGLGLPAGSQVKADRVTFSSKDEAVFSGNVTIAMSGATAVSDRATFHAKSQTFELEGHVQLKVTTPAK